MRRVATLGAAAVLGAGLVAIPGAAGAAVDPVIFQGAVSDLTTHGPVGGVVVEVIDASSTGQHAVLATGVSASSGLYEFELPRVHATAWLRFSDPTGRYGAQYYPGWSDVDPADVFGLDQAGVRQKHAQMVPTARFGPVDPVRVFDSRDPGEGAIGPGGSVDLQLGQLGDDVTAVVLNVTTTEGSNATTFISAQRSGSWGRQPTTSIVNARMGLDVANLAIVGLGPSRGVQLYNNQGTVHLAVDLEGYFSASEGAGYAPITPTRVLDTRTAGAPLRTGERRRVDLAATGLAIPADAVSVAINLTSTNVTATTSYLSAYGVGDPNGPLTSVLNAHRGLDVPNAAIVPVTGGAIELYNNAGQTDVVIDVQGWFTASSGAAFLPYDPHRTAFSDAGWLGPDSARDEIDPGRHIEPPARAVAAALNVTTSQATAAAGYLTVYPAGSARPFASTTNTRTGVDSATSVLVGLGPGYSIYNKAGQVLPFVDVMGYFVSP